MCYVITCFWWFLGKGLQVRLMFLQEEMVFSYKTDIQGVSLYSLEALTLKMWSCIQNYVNNSLAEATGRYRVWDLSTPSAHSLPPRSWVGEELELPRAEPSLIPLPREVIIVDKTWLMVMSLVVQLRSWGVVGCRRRDLLRHLWGRKSEMQSISWGKT